MPGGLVHIEHGIVGFCAEKAKKHKSGHGNGYQHDTVAGGPVGPVLIAFAQGLTEQRVYTYRNTCGETDLQVLDREGEAESAGGIGGDQRYEIGVHDVV